MMAETDPGRTALQWIEAARRADVHAVLALSTDEATLGPVADWQTASGVSVATRHVFAKGDDVVVMQQERWEEPDEGGLLGRIVAARLRVVSGRVAFVERYDRLMDALNDAGLTIADECTINV